LLGLPHPAAPERSLRGMPADSSPGSEAAPRFACLCCAYLTLTSEPPGTFTVCEVCCWEDDPVQGKDPDREGEANVVSLNRARENFRTFGAAELQWVDKAREPRPDEHPPHTATCSSD